MKFVIQRYAAPLTVLGIAFYLGCPDTPSNDYGDNVARAKSVRWRPKDLTNPPEIKSILDPFREARVTTTETKIESGNLVASSTPVGPTQSELESGLRIDGIANVGGRLWAIINGRPRLPGDELQTSDANRYQCEIVAVERDRVVVQCQGKMATLRPAGHKSTSIAAQPQTNQPDSNTPTEPPSGVIPPPPGV